MRRILSPFPAGPSALLLVLAGLCAILLALLAQPLAAAQSEAARGIHVEARLITAEQGVAGGTLSAGLDLQLDPGWKTYWRSPGEVGLPPALDWTGSRNLDGVDLAFPAPERFTAFDIENYGYDGQVVYPLTLRVADPLQPVSLRLRADILVCAEICIPETLDLALDLPAAGGLGLDTDAADTLAQWVARVPGQDGFALTAVHLDGDALTLTARAETPLVDPQVFPERGSASFGAPEIRIGADGRAFWARLPVLHPGEGALDLTLVDGPRAATLRPETLARLPPPPPGQTQTGLLRILALALLGGLILNAMPCVLPVLSLKLARALEASAQGPREMRLSFLTTAAGILTFFGLLALALVGARAAGASVGWGVQFQQPAFLAVLAILMVLFAANLFGAFDFRLTSGAQTAMGRAGGTGRMGDFATGAFAALMATPCSAPFLGTAVAYALTQGPTRTVVVFLALGLGLALPYLAVALRPGWVRLLPRPGRWMQTLRRMLGGLMLIAALWVLWVLLSGAGPYVAGAVALVAAALLAGLVRAARPVWLGGGALALAVAATLLVPVTAPTPARGGDDWAAFAPDAIADHVAAGSVVFVDVTADWCLTCQANKRLVLDRGAVALALEPTVRMQGDWTRPDPAISAYLAGHGRYGIPFNSVYGPGAPQGLALPELLTEAAVLEAIRIAGGPTP